MVGLDRDSVVISRTDPAAADSEGNPTEALTVVASTRGTWGTPSPKDQDRAAQRSTQLDAAVALASSVVVKDGDVLTVRSKTYVVVDVIPLRTHQRLLIREVE